MLQSLLPLALLLTLPTSPLAPSGAPLPPPARLQEQVGAELQLGAGDTLRNLKALPLPLGVVLHVNRFHQGVPVLGESATVQLNSQGAVTGVFTDFSPLSVPGVPTVSAVEARITAIEAVWGVALPPELFRPDAYDDSLAVDGRTGRWIYAVEVPGILPHQRRVVWVDAITGEISRIQNPSRHAEAPGKVFTPHPDPTGDLTDTSEVTLKNLTSDTSLRGAWINSHNCLTSEDHRQVFTCDDILPIFAGQMGFGNTTCSSPLVANFVGQFKNTVLAICGPAHKATPEGDAGYTTYLPLEPDARGAGFLDPAFEDAFAEVGLYYHIDVASVWFQALGHPAPRDPLNGAVNVTIPSGDLLECARGEMEAADASDHDTGVESANACLAEFERLDTPAFRAMPNAFFTPPSTVSSLLGFDDGGIFFFQGPNADFSYDGDVVYHEFGHAIVHQSGNEILTGGNLTDEHGINDAPGALNEAYADYFAGALTEDPVVGGYAGHRAGLGSGIRHMDHSLRCPDFWAGEVHADAWGWAGALWAARALYPQTATDEATGLKIRLFDRAVLSGLRTLTQNATYDQAAAAPLRAVKAEAGLEDPEAELVTEVFSERNVLACKRIRTLSADDSIKELFLVTANTSPGPTDLFGGYQSFRPYAPPPVQFVVDVPGLAPGGPAPHCATFIASLSNGGSSSEAIPDLLGGDDESAPPAYKLQLLSNGDGPVEFTYSGNVTVSSPQQESALDVPLREDLPLFTAPLYFGPNATTVHYALVNGGEAARLTNIRLTGVGENCKDPDATPSNEPVPPFALPEAPTPPPEGCGCQSTSPSAWVLLGRLGAALLRRRGRGVI